MVCFRVKVAVFVSFLSIAFAFETALANPTKKFQIANWSGGPTFDERTKQFSDCSAETSNSRRISISYSVNRKYLWSLTFYNSDWNFSPGHSFNVNLRINDREMPNQRAVIMGTNRLKVQLINSIAFFDALRTAGKLQVHTGGLTFDFNLNASNQVLVALVKCVTQQSNRSRSSVSKNRAVKRPEANKSPAMTADPTIVAEATALATQLTTYLNIDKSQVLAPKDIPREVEGAAVWKAGAVLGTVDIFGSNSGATIDDVPSNIVDQDALKCQREFFAAAAPDLLNRSNVVRVFTTCRMASTTAFKYYLGIPRGKGGYYLLRTSTDEFESPLLIHRSAKDLDDKISAVIMTILSKFEFPTAAVPE